jgi:kynureninase
MGSLGTEDLQQVRKPTFPDEANILEYAKLLDSKDHLRSFRNQFIIPSKANIKTKKVVKPGLPLTP